MHFLFGAEGAKLHKLYNSVSFLVGYINLLVDIESETSLLLGDLTINRVKKHNGDYC